MLYKIGEFSKIVNVPIQTLRYYDEIGLLKPKEVDLFTGYRYYSNEQIDDINLILKLKSLSYSLDEIKCNLNNFTEEFINNKKIELLNSIDDVNKQIKELDNLRSHIENGKIVLNKKDKKDINKDRLVLERR